MFVFFFSRRFFGSEGERGIRSLSPNIKLEEVNQTFLYLLLSLFMGL